MARSSLPPGAYLRPAREGRAELRERGSRFLAVVLPVDDASAASKALAEEAARWPDATHHCWAWRLGREGEPRFSDDGEPSGTAGRPILRALEVAELSDALGVVARWFGGTKLGKGGLARAYAAVTRLAVDASGVDPRIPSGDIVVEAPYAAIGNVKRLVDPPGVELVAEKYTQTARLVLRVADHLRSGVERKLRDLRVTYD